VAGRGVAGGIVALLELIEEHRAAVAYDWRSRFQLPPGVIGEEMPWDEAIGHIRTLQADPSSAIFAAVAGWDYPMSREALLLADIFDLDHIVNSDPKKGRPKPHSMRPVKTDTRQVQKVGNPGSRTRAEVVTYLSGLGHRLPA
jgi:hypothetical protein